MKRSGFARPLYRSASVLGKIERDFTQGPQRFGGGNAKEPAHRLPDLRALAAGEACAVMLGGACSCPQDTTVWAHTNRLADRKGMGYKASDELGFFAGFACHREIDQGKMSAEEIDAAVELAQFRSRARLRQISESYSVPQWKQKAAQKALQLLEAG